MCVFPSNWVQRKSKDFYSYQAFWGILNFHWLCVASAWAQSFRVSLMTYACLQSTALFFNLRFKTRLYLCIHSDWWLTASVHKMVRVVSLKDEWNCCKRQLPVSFLWTCIQSVQFCKQGFLYVCREPCTKISGVFWRAWYCISFWRVPLGGYSFAVGADSFLFAKVVGWLQKGYWDWLLRE